MPRERADEQSSRSAGQVSEDVLEAPSRGSWWDKTANGRPESQRTAPARMPASSKSEPETPAAIRRESELADRLNANGQSGAGQPAAGQLSTEVVQHDEGGEQQVERQSTNSVVRQDSRNGSRSDTPTLIPTTPKSSSKKFIAVNPIKQTVESAPSNQSTSDRANSNNPLNEAGQEPAVEIVQQGATASQQGAQEDTILDLNDERLKVRRGNELVPLKTVVNEDVYRERLDRKAGRMSDDLKLASQVKQDPFLVRYTAYKNVGFTDLEAQARANADLGYIVHQTPAPGAQPTTQQTANQQPINQQGVQPNADPEPQPPRGFVEGDPEYEQYKDSRMQWLVRQQMLGVMQKELAPLMGFIQQQQQVNAQAAGQQNERRATFVHNQIVAESFKEHLPFDFDELSDAQQETVFAKLRNEGVKRGFDFTNPDILETKRLDPLFIENLTLRVFPQGSAAPEDTPQQGQQQNNNLQQGQTQRQQAPPANAPPLVPKAPPKPPLMPVGAPGGYAPPAPPRTRGRSSEPSWVSKVEGRK